MAFKTNNNEPKLNSIIESNKTENILKMKVNFFNSQMESIIGEEESIVIKPSPSTINGVKSKELNKFYIGKESCPNNDYTFKDDLIGEQQIVIDYFLSKFFFLNFV